MLLPLKVLPMQLPKMPKWYRALIANAILTMIPVWAVGRFT